MVSETTRLFSRERDQAVSPSNRCSRGDIVGEFLGLSLISSIARLVEPTLVLEHGGHVNRGHGDIDQEVLTLAMEVEPGHITGAGAIGAEAAKLRATFFAASQVRIAGTSLLTASSNGLSENSVGSVEGRAPPTAAHAGKYNTCYVVFMRRYVLKC